MVEEIVVHQNAVDFLKGLKKSIRDKIKTQMLKLNKIDDWKRLDVKKLKGTKGRKDFYRLRVGKYRVIFTKEKNIVYITEIFHKERGYR